MTRVRKKVGTGLEFEFRRFSSVMRAYFCFKIDGGVFLNPIVVFFFVVCCHGYSLLIFSVSEAPEILGFQFIQSRDSNVVVILTAYGAHVTGKARN